MYIVAYQQKSTIPIKEEYFSLPDEPKIANLPTLDFHES
jgi:hypothetical protein